MDLVVFFRDGMRADDHLQTELFPDEIPKVRDIRARGIPDKHSRGEVYDLCSVLLHLLGSRFYVPAGASVTRGKSNELDLVILVHPECPFPAVQRTEALSTGASMIAMTVDDPYLRFFAHNLLL